MGKSSSSEVVLFSPQIEIFMPFAGHVDASRANMASKQQLQAVVSSKTERPFVIAKEYQKLTKMNSPFAEFAIDDGYVLFSDYETIVIYYTSSKRLVTKSVPPVKKMVNNSLSLKYKADAGPIKKGDLLYDYTNMEQNSLLPRIGYRARILFSSFYGYTADDAIVISESFAKKAEIEYQQKIFIPITKEWKFLRNNSDNFFFDVGETLDQEAFTKYFTIDAGEHFMAEIHNISDEESIFFTKEISGIQGGIVKSIKVHRGNDKPFKQLEKEYLYTPGLINEIEKFWLRNLEVKTRVKSILLELGLDNNQAEKYADELYTSYYSQPKFTKHFEEKISNEFGLDPESVDLLLEVTIEKRVPTTRGDKFTNLFAGKGTVSMIIPDELMPVDPNTGEKVDVIFNPLGIFGRNNWGSIFELAISKIADNIEELARNGKISEIVDRVSFINEYFIKKYDEEYYNNVNTLLNEFEKQPDLLKKFIEDIAENGFYLFAPNFPNIPYKVFWKEFLLPYSKKFGLDFGKSKVEISKDLIRWLRENWQYKNEAIGNSIYATEIDAFVGSNYFLKLYHTAYSKFTSVSLANSYSKITGQPARGRKKTGGQHISWQTLAALLGHKENNGILKELYTIKSDAPLKEKEKFLMSYITHGKYTLKPTYVSLTKRTVNNGLKILGMKFQENPFGTDNDALDQSNDPF